MRAFRQNLTITGIMSEGRIYSDVTTAAYYFRSRSWLIGTGAFTIGYLAHYKADKAQIYGGIVNIQVGFDADESLGNASSGGYALTNYGFRGSIPTSGFSTNYNLYMDGTAYNYLRGITGIGAVPSGTYNLEVTGTSSFSGNTNLRTITGSVTASSSIGRYLTISPTLVAAANSDVLSAVYINPTFTNGAYSSVTNYALNVAGQGYFYNTEFDVQT